MPAVVGFELLFNQRKGSRDEEMTPRSGPLTAEHPGSQLNVGSKQAARPFIVCNKRSPALRASSYLLASALLVLKLSMHFKKE
jgi:hypothetical protein